MKLRFADNIAEGTMVTVTTADFTKIINAMKDKESPWHMNAVLALAKDDDEAVSLRKIIKEAAEKEEYKNILFIDALSTPLGEEDFNSYIEYSAMSLYYQGNNNQSAKENANKAAQVLFYYLEKNKIYNGPFVIYHSDCKEGEKVIGGQAVTNTLQSYVISRHKFVFDFSRGLTENQLKLTQGKAAAKCGIIKKNKWNCSKCREICSSCCLGMWKITGPIRQQVHRIFLK